MIIEEELERKRAELLGEVEELVSGDVSPEFLPLRAGVRWLIDAHREGRWQLRGLAPPAGLSWLCAWQSRSVSFLSGLNGV